MSIVPSLAKVCLKDVALEVIIGTMDQERVRPQTVKLDISFEYDSVLASRTDALGHAVDYAALHQKIMAKAAVTQFFLLERLAAFVLEVVMEDPKILAATVIIEKQGVLPGVKVVSVEASCRRTEGQEARGFLRCY